jgi:hypothetical protein
VNSSIASIIFSSIKKGQTVGKAIRATEQSIIVAEFLITGKQQIHIAFLT